LSAQHRDDPVTRETVWRVYQMPEDLREAMRQRRLTQGLTVRELVADSLEELPGLRALLREHLPRPSGDLRPIRLPLTEELLEQLRAAGEEVGLPATRLLLACLARAARRKRRRRGRAPEAFPAPTTTPAPEESTPRRGRRRRGVPPEEPAAASAPVEAEGTHLLPTAESHPALPPEEIPASKPRGRRRRVTPAAPAAPDETSLSPEKLHKALPGDPRPEEVTGGDPGAPSLRDED
jgi:hypothetical protein